MVIALRQEILNKIYVNGVLWDYGNTLVLDPFPKVVESIAEKCVELIRNYGYTVSPEKFKEEYSKANKEVNYSFCTHFTQEEPIIMETLLRLGIKEKDAQLIAPQILFKYRERLQKHLENDPRNKEVREVLKWIKENDFKQGVFSNDRKWSLRAALDISGMREYFDVIDTSEERGIEKPDPRAFDYILEVLELQPQETVYIGDDPKRDVECAKDMGMKAILYQRPREESIASWRNYDLKPKYKPDAIITDLKQLPLILRKL